MSLQVDFVPATAVPALLRDPHVLAVIGFGSVPLPPDPRCLRVALPLVLGSGQVEVWRGDTTVEQGCDDGIAWSGHARLRLGALELAEPGGDIAAAAEQAYARLSAWLAAGPTPCLLRVWNYADALLAGHGDDERYRRFCVGRARGWAGLDNARLPAATCIGREDGQRVLQLYWLAADQPGTSLENPRQVAAWRYPRRYGPQPPNFARALLPAEMLAAPLLISGTASVVGHASRHPGDVAAQLEETCANLEALLQAARARRPALAARWRLKAYVRHPEDAVTVDRLLATRFGAEVARLILAGTVCRDDLLVEVEATCG